MHGIDIDPHPCAFAVTAPAKSSAVTARKAAPPPRRLPRTSALAVFIVPSPPDAVLIATLGCTVQPRVHAPQRIQAAREGRIGVINNALIERECTHAGPLAHVG